MPSHTEYPASSALALEIIDCWNEKDIERLISSYHPAVVRLLNHLNIYLCIYTVLVHTDSPHRSLFFQLHSLDHRFPE